MSLLLAHGFKERTSGVRGERGRSGLKAIRFAEGGTRKAKVVKQERFIKASKADGLSTRWCQPGLQGDARLIKNSWGEFVVGAYGRSLW